MPHEAPGVEGEQIGEAKPGRGRLVAIATVLTTLAAATTGYMQANALHEHAEQAVRAERLAALAVRASASNADKAQVQIDRWHIWRQERLEGRAAARTSRPEAARWRRVAAVTRAHTRQIRRQQRLAIRCSVGTAVCAGQPLPAAGGPGPEGALRLTAAAQWEGYRLSALREAANQQADAAESRFGHLAAALTMLAVAVFLFGYSLTPQGVGHRALFASVATGFAVFGLVWAVYHGTRGLEEPPESTAVAFANGKVALQEGRLEAAARDLRQAVAEWPKAITAYADLADVDYQQGENAKSLDAYSVPALRSVRAAVADDRRALANGSEAPTVKFDLAANLLFAGLMTHDDGEVSEARDLSRESTLRFEEQLTEDRHPGFLLIASAFTTAEADLALKRGDTHAAYCSAIEQMLQLKDEVDSGLVDEAAKADLALIVRAHPDLRGEAAAIRREVHSAVAKGAPSCSTGP